MLEPGLLQPASPITPAYRKSSGHAPCSAKEGKPDRDTARSGPAECLREVWSSCWRAQGESRLRLSIVRALLAGGGRRTAPGEAGHRSSRRGSGLPRDGRFRAGEAPVDSLRLPRRRRVGRTGAAISLVRKEVGRIFLSTNLPRAEVRMLTAASSLPATRRGARCPRSSFAMCSARSRRALPVSEGFESPE